MILAVKGTKVMVVRDLLGLKNASLSRTQSEFFRPFSGYDQVAHINCKDH